MGSEEGRNAGGQEWNRTTDTRIFIVITCYFLLQIARLRSLLNANQFCFCLRRPEACYLAVALGQFRTIAGQ